MKPPFFNDFYFGEGFFVAFFFSSLDPLGSRGGKGGGGLDMSDLAHWSGDLAIRVDNFRHLMFIQFIIDGNGGAFCGDGDSVPEHGFSKIHKNNICWQNITVIGSGPISSFCRDDDLEVCHASQKVHR